MAKPTHFVLNNEDHNLSIDFVGSEKACLKHVRGFTAGDEPYDHSSETKLAEGMHRFDFYLGSHFVLPLGIDLNSEPAEAPIATMLEITEPEDDGSECDQTCNMQPQEDEEDDRD